MKELPIAQIDFIPCKTCSNILTEECFDNCVHEGDFGNYRQRPGTDIRDMTPFPLQEVLNYDNPRHRLLVMSIFLTAVVDFLQHMEEYQKNREYYKRGSPEDYSI